MPLGEAALQFPLADVRLRPRGVDNLVVDSSSIEVDRRQQRAKTDRLDLGKLWSMLFILIPLEIGRALLPLEIGTGLSCPSYGPVITM